MADNDNVISATTRLDVSGLQSGMAQAQTIVASGVGNIQSQYVAASAASTASANQFNVAIASLRNAIAEENSALSLAIQRNMAMSQSLRTVGESANSAGFSFRYAFFGVKDPRKAGSSSPWPRPRTNWSRWGAWRLQPASLWGA